MAYLEWFLRVMCLKSLVLDQFEDLLKNHNNEKEGPCVSIYLGMINNRYFIGKREGLFIGQVY